MAGVTIGVVSILVAFLQSRIYHIAIALEPLSAERVA